MPITTEENFAYGQFVHDIACQLGVFVPPNNNLVWHYTDGAGLMGILESGQLFATQVSSLNDSKETLYARELFIKAVRSVIRERQSDTQTVQFLNNVLDFLQEEYANPTQGISKFFVTCFSEDRDSNDQWMKYSAQQTGKYAIGFHPHGLNREPNSSLYRVIYDPQKQEWAARQLVEGTLRFYQEGLRGERLNDTAQWAREFYPAWDEWIYKLAPIAKAHKWESEHEYRIVHELRLSDFPKVRFSQKKTMISRYLKLDFPSWVKERNSRLPIASVMLGPGSQHHTTKVSVRLLLDQMGYPDVPIETSDCTVTDR